MELKEALRTTGAVREFTGEPVADEVLYEILDTARFAPSGGNRQGWRAIVVRDPGLRRELRDLYLPGWYDYLAMGRAGLVPWAPLTDREAERAALAGAPAIAAAADGTGFAERLHEVPALVVVLADLRALAAVDRDHDRYTLVGGASIYPFVWSLLLAAHDAGLGGVMTTMLVQREKEVRTLLGVPDEFAVGAVVALGHPVRRPTRLRRSEVAEFATVDRFDGPAVAP
ncbi:NADH dehydrogenase FAD-containing subunit [Actinomadura craniellae]|uniref:NADH dehydrogenase FAD-containing subunit n=1 Tax=Actinomadura craniellae TaxID=2231787 RepID=A0A365H2R1_9ACTN|nr:nitroreductase family protein [Actinomadura craniellae]RAY13390.1 NADH dehydrogenase FAD-containing subunit [Actinomadura craniellae]